MSDPKLVPFSLHTTAYKTVQGVEISAHILIPKSIATSTTPGKYPVLVRFHGGFLVTGSALYTEWLPNWALDLVVKNGALFIMPDYRLLPEASGKEIVEDVKDFWTWLASDVNGLSSYLSGVNSNLSVDFEKVAIHGESAGGYLAIRSSLLPEQFWGSKEGFTGPKAVIAAYPMTLLRKEWYSVASEIKSPFGVPQMDEGFLNDHIADIGKGGEKIVISADPPARLEIAVTMVQRGRWTEIFKRDGEEGLWLEDVIENVDEKEGQKRPYLLTFHGTKDTAVPWEDTKELVEIYGKKFGEDRVKGIWNEGMEHGFDGIMDEEKGEGKWLQEELEVVKREWLGN
ncbi:uncharacterized protein EAF01_008078 [Botrytis porri]|uniref:Alpha/beta hydrolase fold-3 domain-containing protein n=1 Tax=Botrytis porri TaxID=87229 RepID=A0A4Z1KFA3_9HELO|nr:uncharacterized protein EAF01_008078 [Botrytis porri]KAF7898865.1 hypothetical protein EAF01_008078 [Botrytis porri]TGO84300.1 hypothetical protein BPOR_0523g00090 [Botrytis porri]